MSHKQNIIDIMGLQMHSEKLLFRNITCALNISSVSRVTLFALSFSLSCYSPDTNKYLYKKR